MSVFFTRRGKAAPRGPELLDNFADNPWENIIWACQTGNVPDTWTVASQKPMPINGTNYPVDIIGLNHDDYADGSGKAPITFQMHDSYGTKYAMNSSATNSGGWTSCVMRNTTLPAILALMPSEVQAAIREVNKLTSAGGGSSTINTTADKLFLLSEVEVFGSVASSKSGEGSYYAYYSAGNSTQKLCGGSSYGWWWRSPVGSNTANFCRSDTNGNKGTASAEKTYGVAFGFCF